jgi:hypothetical protein
MRSLSLPDELDRIYRIDRILFMTTEEHQLLQDTIAAAKRIAVANGLRMAVVDALYTEHDSERFQFLPLAGVSTLYRSGHCSLVGIAYPSRGFYRTASEIADLLDGL